MLTEDISTQLEEKKEDGFIKIHNNFKITILSENFRGPILRVSKRFYGSDFDWEGDSNIDFETFV